MRRATILIAVALAALAGAALAGAAGITVFKTSFSSRAEYRAMRELSGPHKQCKKNWEDKTAVGVVVKGGPVDCTLSSPVQGDAPQSNQIVRVVAKLNKETDDKVKKSVFVGVIVRASRKEGYELRVFPKGKRFELLKSGEILAQGREKAIEGVAKKNRLEIEAIRAGRGPPDRPLLREPRQVEEGPGRRLLRQVQGPGARSLTDRPAGPPRGRGARDTFTAG
jgi:hypothetical protein